MLEVIGLLGFLIILASLGYLIYYFIERRKNPERKFDKKKFSIVLASGLLLFVTALILTDTNDLHKLNEAHAENEELSNQISELEYEIEDLKTEIDSFDEKDESQELLDEQTENVERLQEKNKSLEKELDSVDSKNEELALKNEELENKIDELKGELKSVNSSASASTDSETQSSGNSNSNSQSTETTKSKEDCDIKGSVNGIYHTPGSTYYSRTKNVVEWFCSEEEARNAGYRAPER